MPNRSLTILGWCAALALCACGKSTVVELQLYPCALGAGEPTGVVLAIQAYDDAGAPAGGLLTETFAISDASVFSDGYATVAFHPPEGAVTADFTVRWTAASEEAVVVYAGLQVPALGDRLELGADGCSDVGETSTGTTTDDPGTTDTTTTGTTSTTTIADTSTGEPSSTSTTDATSTSASTTDATTTTGETTEATSTGEPDTTGGGPMEGLPCVGPQGALACDGGPGVLGALLECSGGTWQAASAQTIDKSCEVSNACAGLGLAAPMISGCLGDDEAWSCACTDAAPVACAGGSACGPMVDDFVQVEVCVSDDMLGTVRHRGLCVACEDTADGALCVMI